MIILLLDFQKRILKKNRMSIITFLDIKWSLLELVVKRVVYAYVTY